MSKPLARVLGFTLLLSFLVAACPTIAVSLTPDLTEPEPIFVITIYSTIYRSDLTTAIVGPGIGATDVRDQLEASDLQYTFDERGLIEADWPQRRLVFDGSILGTLDRPNWIFSSLNRFSASFRGVPWAEGEVIAGMSATGHDGPVLFLPDLVSDEEHLEMLFLDGFNSLVPLEELRLSSIRPVRDAEIGEFLKGWGLHPKP